MSEIDPTLPQSERLLHQMTLDTINSLPPIFRETPRLQDVEPLEWQSGLRQKLLDRRGMTSPNVFISGPTGTGKTYLSIAYLIERLELSAEVFTFISARDIASSERFDQKNILQTLRDVSGTLMLDDIGAENSNYQAKDRLYGVVDTCLCYNKPIVITSNMELGGKDSISSKRGDKLASRIARLCGPNLKNVLELQGEDASLFGGAE